MKFSLLLPSSWRSSWRRPAYQLVDSEVGSMGDAYVTLRGECPIWHVARDRSQLYLECRRRTAPNDRWITTDLLIRLLEGRRVQSAVY